MTINQCEAFITAAELKNISKAADRLGYTQSGISRQIRVLEQEWGFDLFQRTRHGVILTDEGRQLLPYVRQVLESEAFLQKQIFSLRKMGTHALTVGTISSIALYWMPRFLELFSGQYSNIKISILNGTYSMVERGILDGTLDCGFVSLPSLDSLSVWPLMKDRMMVVLNQENKLSGRTALTPRDLADQPLIIPAEGVDHDIGRAFEQAGIRINSQLRINDDYSAIVMIRRGFGVTILPEQEIDLLPTEGLIVIPLDQVERIVGIAVRNPRNMSSEASAFLQCVQKVTQAVPAHASG